ncbi:hypothetical protein D931_03637 [Enterococcus faecium 13.SD.W.09]|nr:hypothetical protein D931_03637 [Enterococcus faecium 13.SD.W.09]
MDIFRAHQAAVRHLQGVFFRIIQDDQGPDIIIPSLLEGEDLQCHNDWSGNRQHGDGDDRGRKKWHRIL